jgi:type IV pilus assembly protein PilA
MLRRSEAGFTLIEMLIVVLLVGVLAAIAAPIYFGYTKDARISEGKGIMGSVWSSVQGCAQALPGTTCDTKGQWARAGLDSTTGKTQDGRWTETVSTGNSLTMNSATGVFTGTTGAIVQLEGTASTDVAGLKVQLLWNNATKTTSVQCDAATGTFVPC